MEKPAPLIQIETPKETKSKKYELKDKFNNKYELTITVKDNKLFFNLNDIGDLSITYSKSNLTLEDLQKISWVFFRYDNIYTLFDKTFFNMKENQIELLKKDNTISVIRNILQDDDVIKIQFDLESKTSTSEQKVNNLVKKVIEQDKIINELKEKIEKQNKLLFVLFKMNYKKSNLKFVSKRNYICDICRKSFLENSYYCESLDFDICENCFGKI